MDDDELAAVIPTTPSACMREVKELALLGELVPEWPGLLVVIAVRMKPTPPALADRLGGLEEKPAFGANTGDTGEGPTPHPTAEAAPEALFPLDIALSASSMATAIS